MNAHVLIIGGLRPLHKELKKLGARLTLMNNVGKLQGGDAKVYDRVIGISGTATVEEWLELAQAVHRVDPFTAIGAYHEKNQEFAALIAKKLGLPFHEEEVVQLVSNKYLMRKRLRETGVDLIRGEVVQTMAEMIAFAREVGYPVILKPLDGWASIGISKIECEEDVQAAYDWIVKSAPHARMYVEQFLTGTEFSVEAISHQGNHHIICITQKFKEEEHFVEVGHCLPVLYDTPEGEHIERFVKDVLQTIGIQNGATHTEIILTADGPHIVETHTRLGGDYIPDLVEAVSGANLMHLWARQTLGENIEPDIPKLQGPLHAAIWYTTPNAIGIVERVDHEEEAAATPGVIRIGIAQGVGTQLQGVTDSFARSAYAITTGGSQVEALNCAQEATSKLRFVVSCN